MKRYARTGCAFASIALMLACSEAGDTGSDRAGSAGTSGSSGASPAGSGGALTGGTGGAAVGGMGATPNGGAGGTLAGGGAGTADSGIGDVSTGGAAGAAGTADSGIGDVSTGGAAGAGGAAPAEPGLHLDYFRDLRDLTFSDVDPVVDHDWADAGPAPGQPREAFSARWTGSVVPRFTETYTLQVEYDDGVRLFVDGDLRIEDFVPGAVRQQSTQVEMTADQPCAISLEYFQLDFGAVARLSWSSPSQARQIIPQDRLIAAAADPQAQAPVRPNYTNPVTTDGWPDPGVIAVPGEGTTPTTYYLVATGGSFPIRSSLNLVKWTDTGARILPGGVAPWAPDGGRNWAPEIHRIGGKYVAYYTSSAPASALRSNPLAIGAAVADDILGPYQHLEQPLVPAGDYGTIDATAFVDDDGTGYLYFKTDGNCCGVKTGIYVRELAAGGLSFASGSSQKLLIENIEPWEAHVIEGPWIFHRGSYYYLFYSADSYLDPYKTGVARATSPTGPFQKFASNPILVGDDEVQGPGHGSVLQVGDQTVFAHHGWVNGKGRYLFVSPVTWENDWPRIGDGTTPTGPMPWP